MAGRREDCRVFAVADAAFKTAEMPHECLVGETLYKQLTRVAFNYDLPYVWGTGVSYHSVSNNEVQVPTFTLTQNA